MENILDELEQIQAQIADLQRKADELASQKKATVIDEVKAKIKAYGLTARDLGLGDMGSTPAPMKKPVAIKYRKGEDTWTGRGRKPLWIAEHIEQGGKLEDLAV